MAHGQAQRIILPRSDRAYLSKVKVMTKILNESADIRVRSLVTNRNASGDDIPMSAENAQLLFAAISIEN